MTDLRADSRLFEDLTCDLLSQGLAVRFQARGASMSPVIRDGEVVQVTPVIVSKLRKDDIVLTKSNNGFRIHRLVIADHERDVFVTRGDCGLEDDPVLRGNQILGLAQAKEVRIGRSNLEARFGSTSGRMLRMTARGQMLAMKAVRRTLSIFPRFNKDAGSYSRLLALVFILLAGVGLKAQVTVDATTSTSGTAAGTGTTNFTFAHTTTTTANRVMVVGVSLNITNNNAAAVTKVTYNGTNLTLIGAHNDTTNSRRIEMWYLLAPSTGNHNVVVTVNVPTRVNIGVVASATTFIGVDQTVPLGTFVSADGAASGCVAVANPASQCNSQLDVPSVVNGMVLDTLATDGTIGITVPSPQVSQWNARSANSTNPGVRGVGTSRSGAPSVPIAELFDDTSNWAVGAISINPTTADIGVTTSVASAVFLGQNTSYTITVTNNGPSAANNVVLTDTWSTTNFSTISITPSAGTTCTAAPPPITCTLPATLASGGSATVTVVNSASASGNYANTASVTDSASPADPNTGNNTYTAVATVQSIACATTTQAAAGGTLSGTQNTYYPGSSSVTAGATSIPVGTPVGSSARIASGNLLLIIQMQDASINDANSVVYGNGSTGQGFTSLNSAGNYEFVTATSTVTAGAVTISGAGTGGGTVFAYNAAAATATKGKSSYQVILIPQYTTATLPATGLTALAWNGSTGGVLALDTSSTLNLNGATVSVDGLGFRGGAGMQLTGGITGATNTDFVEKSPAAYTGATGGATGIDASKGEGIAGTPTWVQSAGTFLNTGTGYPSGTSGLDGSMARGAPGNGGGGGTDGDATGNSENSGGGGGGNGGAGGFGGNSWSVNLSDGGEGGAAFPATINRVALGGGGGAGTRNNSDGDNQASAGAAGGGIIIIRAAALTGTATLTANGAAAYNGTSNDAGGGGGAGGSIVVLSAGGGEAGLTLQANGGRGGDAWDSEGYNFADRHGPGGGGGGGVVLVSGTPASISLNGGTSGTTLNPGVTYGATAGAAGNSNTSETISQTSGTQSGAQCTPDMTLGKSHTGNFVRGATATYTIPVSNLGIYGSSSGVVTVNDTLPLGLTPTGTAPSTGWSCSIVSQTVSCSRSDGLAAGNSYVAPITITASIAQTAPATITNTASVGGGGEINLANDTATDIATVTSTADLSVADTGTPNPVAAGSNITYTQIVTNSGPSAADNATFVATVPTNTTFVSVTAPTGWTCVNPGVGNPGKVICTNADMLAATNATFVMAVNVNPGTANGTVITETAAASSSTTDPTSTNNTASVSTVVGTTAPDLTVTNSASPNPVAALGNITYTQKVTNTGATAATGATFTEATPANTTFVSLAAPAGWTCLTPPPISCTDPSVAAGATGTFTVIYKVNTGTANGTIITDTATVNATNQSFGANSASATDIVGSATQADLALTTAATPTVFAGNNITYVQTITNNGPGAATAATFTEAIPANTTFVSVSAPAGWTCTTTTSVTCTNPTLAAGASADIFVTVDVAASDTASPITATSSVSSTTSDPTATNNSTTATTTVTAACDLTVTNTGTPNPITAGSNITYTQTITNNGPSNCATATFTEPTPANTTFVSAAVTTTGGGTWTCPNAAPISCTNPSVPPGSTGTITAVYKVTAGTAAGTVITDTDTGATTGRDTNKTDNTATMNIAVAGATQADLSLTNSATPNPVTAGGNITYTQVVQNLGPAVAGSATAGSITLTEALPANTTAVSLTGPAGWTCSVVTLKCTNNAGTTLAATATASFSFVVAVNTGVASGTTITDSASVAETTPADPTAINNTATASVQVGNSAALSVTDSNSPIPVTAGSSITYTQVVTNAGPSAATTATFTENTPAGTTYQSVTPPAGWTCTHPAVGSAGTISCTNPSMAVGSGSFSVVVQVAAGTAAGTAIVDTVTVGSAVSDPNSANNTVSAADVVATATQADLVATNVATPTSVTAGSNITYTQGVTNDGPAAATGATFTQTTPLNTTFQSITPPAGWTCITPAVGAVGVITCTDGSNLAVNASASFSLVLQVAPNTPTGTNIAETVIASSTNIVPSLTNNSATATVVVADVNSADVAIVKTATPNPVLEGDILTYTLTVTNNGPASATNATATDTLPSAVTYLSVTTTTGSCSEAGATVTCLFGTMANVATATVTIVTIAGTPGQVSNTATVSADQTDPTPANNSSTQIETIVAPTGIQLQSFTAHTVIGKNGANQTALVWKTGGELHNLGFNVYREQNGRRVQLNSSLIAGSALLMSGATPKHSGKSYSWIDSSAATDAAYWLEDVDVSGARILHGPVRADNTTTSDGIDYAAAQATTFSQLNQSQPVSIARSVSRQVETVPQTSVPTKAQLQKQFDLDAQPAVKILVKHEGWYRVTQPELVKAGLDPNADPALLHLYSEAVEQPIQITGATAGQGGFGAQAAINFYGTGIDTLYSGTRVYWLIAESSNGARLLQAPISSGSNAPPDSFPYTVELQQHTTYFGALRTAEGDNFFGALVSQTPVDQTLFVPHFDKTSTEPVHMEVVLQGVIAAFPHDVTIALNGTSLGSLTYTGQDKGRLSLAVPAGLLQDGNNTVTLAAQNGAYDINLVDYIRITYPHLYAADSDQLKFTARVGDQINVSGFQAAPGAVIDITDAAHPVPLTPQVTSKNGKYEVALQIPWTTTNSTASLHTLMAVANDRVSRPAGIRANHPSQWHLPQPGANIIMLTYQEFAAALAPLVQSHEAAGKSAVIVPIDDLYDEFNFGERTPYAVKHFLQSTANWNTVPKYLLLNGRASFDPRDYLGMGHLDFVPTKIVPTSSLMTSSDDWFSDFKGNGMPTIATGRLPVSTPEEAKAVVDKIVAYEGQSTNGPWTAQGLLIADQDEDENFTQDSQLIQAQMPSTMQVTDVFTGDVGVSAARDQIVAAINSGQLLVNYLGHGSEDQWSGSNIFDNATATALTNGTQLPVFLIMDCLNGYFQDVYDQPLAVTLMLAPNGGGVAVLASTGLNQAAPQTTLDKLVVQNLLSPAHPTLGDSILKAKSHINDFSVRRTYVLFGDPAMQIKSPSTSTSSATAH
jgi:uncharacterized repeat protein (TIGR01451 family)